MLNAQPLNAGPLNSLPSADAPVDPPVVIDPGLGFAWSVRVMLGGTDVSDSLTSGVRIDRPEDGDSVATFALWLGLEPVSVMSYTGLPLTIDFIAAPTAGDPETVDRRFTGYLVQPEFDVLRRVLSCEATTRLQDSIETMSFAGIDMLVGGLWSEDVFEPTEGRSRWDYAQERLSTRPASLNVDRYGAPRLTNWHSTNTAFEFAPGTTIHQSIDIGLAALSETTNVIELELDYRFTRYRQRWQSYSWGVSGGFEGYLQKTHELPDIPMVVDAVESSGWFITSATWGRLPGDITEGPLAPWYNQYLDLLLSASFKASIRWSQRAVEQYRVRMEISEAVAAVGEVIKRERVVLDTDTDTDRLWEMGRPSNIDGDPPGAPVDVPKRDAPRLDRAMHTALARGKAQLLAAARGNIASWQVPLAHALPVDLGQRVKLEDQGASVTGTVITLVDEMDIESGAALLTVSIAVSNGSEGTESALVTPSAPAFEDDVVPAFPSALSTQIGLMDYSPPYDEELPGFAGSYSIGNGDPELRYPRRFLVNTPEIPAQWRDEVQAERAVTYSIVPPADLMEM